MTWVGTCFCGSTKGTQSLGETPLGLGRTQQGWIHRRGGGRGSEGQARPRAWQRWGLQLEGICWPRDDQSLLRRDNPWRIVWDRKLGKIPQWGWHLVMLVTRQCDPSEEWALMELG